MNLGATVAGAVRGVARTAGRAVGAATVDVTGALVRAGEAVHAAATGRRIGPATLRVAVAILSDPQGRPLTSADRIAPALGHADRILRREAGIRVRVTRVAVIEEPAPAVALDPRANRLLLLDDVLGRTGFYRRHTDDLGRAMPATAVGVPVTVIVVREIAGRTTGCSLGINADWVVVEASLFDRDRPHTYDETVLAHELGHALNLPHHRDPANLMFPASSPPNAVRGTAMTSWQAALLHANRHVVPGQLRRADD